MMNDAQIVLMVTMGVFVSWGVAYALVQLWPLVFP